MRIEFRNKFWQPYHIPSQVSEVKLLEATPGNETKFQPSPNQESFKKDVEANSLLFTENNRRFEVVGPHISEPLYVTNIKRGILSALQLQSVEEQQKVFTEVLNHFLENPCHR